MISYFLIVYKKWSGRYSPDHFLCRHAAAVSENDVFTFKTSV